MRFEAGVWIVPAESQKSSNQSVFTAVSTAHLLLQAIPTS